MFKAINNVIKTKQLCELYANRDDTSRFDVGTILACNYQYYIGCYISKYGDYDGLSCKLLNNLYAIQTNTAYLHSMQKLMQFKKASLDDSLNYSDNLLINFLKQIQSEKRSCSIALNGDDYNDVFCYVDIVDEQDDIVTVIIIDSQGNADGTMVADIDSISAVSYKTRLTTALEMLNK